LTGYQSHRQQMGYSRWALSHIARSSGPAPAQIESGEAWQTGQEERLQLCDLTSYNSTNCKVRVLR
jgi:hypothetical protein